MNWRNLALLPDELMNKDILLRIVPSDGQPDIYIVGTVDEAGNVYTDKRFGYDVGGFLVKAFYRAIYYIDPMEIML